MSYTQGQYQVAPGQPTIIETAQTGIGSLVLANESAYTITVSFPGTSSSATLHAYTIDNIAVPGGFNGNVVLSAVAILANSGSAPSAVVIVDVYGLNEVPSGTYPVALARLQNVGNSVNTVAQVNNIVNDGGSAGTSIIEAKPASATASAVTLDNNGHLTLGDTTNYQGSAVVNGYVQTGTVIGTGGNLAVNNGGGNLTIGTSANPVTTTSYGNWTINNGVLYTAAVDAYGQLHLHASNLLLDNNNSIEAYDNGGVVRPLLVGSNTNKTLLYSIGGTWELRDVTNAMQWSFDPSNGTLLVNSSSGVTIQLAGGKNVFYASASNSYIDGANSSVMRANGANVAVATATGFSLNQRLNLPSVGGLQAVSTFTGTGSGTVSHGLGITPDFIDITCTAAGSSATFGYSAPTATQVTITAGASVAWKATAWKF